MNESSTSDGHPDQFSPEHRLRRLQSPRVAAPSRSKRPRIGWELAVIGLAVAVAIVLWPHRREATADFPEAKVLADQIQVLVDPVWRGEVAFEDIATPADLRIYEVDVGGRSAWLVTHAQPTAHGTCYGLRSGGGLVSAAVRFAPTDGCLPQANTVYETSGSWDEVLPRQWATPLWFVPGVGLLAAAVLGAGGRIVTKLAFR